VCSADPVPPWRLNAEVTAGVEACRLRYPRASDVFTRLGYFRSEPEGAGRP